MIPEFLFKYNWTQSIAHDTIGYVSVRDIMLGEGGPRRLARQIAQVAIPLATRLVQLSL